MSIAAIYGVLWDETSELFRSQAIKIYLILTLGLYLIQCDNNTEALSIDRYALVNRHLPTCDKLDPLSPFTVGNGEFAFTVDVTGLQTLSDQYLNGIPLLTQSNWGWHTNPNTNDYHEEQTRQLFDTYGRLVPYASIMNSKAAQYLPSNPHRLNLARIGLKWISPHSADIQPTEVGHINQVMDIWDGIIKSSFILNGYDMTVETSTHPDVDQVAGRIQSSDLKSAAIGISFDFPYGSPDWGKTASDWNSPDKHTSISIESGEDFVIIERRLDTTVYFVTLRWNGAARLRQIKNHSYLLEIYAEKKFEFTCRFSPVRDWRVDDAASTLEHSSRYWHRFWKNGGAIDLSKSTHPDAKELERRIILSQYLTAIQCSGSLPPQETGLTINSWYGKFHLEMHWWHAVHFILWERPELLEKSMSWYESILPLAREIYQSTETMNPAFELSYWAYGLKIAQLWREHLGLERIKKWDHVLTHLARLPINNGFYQNAETARITFQDAFHRRDHPTVLGAYGMIPNDQIDQETMRKTLDQVMTSWDWEHTWGWDYPLVAMTAARVNRPEVAIEALLMDVEKNTYLNNGHNYQSERLPVYLPGNGGLLTAVAMMAAGWDGAPQVHAPGFPQDSNWVVEFENLEPLP